MVCFLLKKPGLPPSMTNTIEEFLVNSNLFMDNNNYLQDTSSNFSIMTENRLEDVDFLKYDDSDDYNSLFPNLNKLGYLPSDNDDFTDVSNDVTPTSTSFKCVMETSNNSDQDFTSTTAISTTSITTELFDNNASTCTPTIHNDFLENNNDEDNNQKENVITLNTTLPDEKNKDGDIDNLARKKLLLRNKKNAEMAKANRQKKKDYVQNLENKVRQLTESNDKFKQERDKLLSLVKNKDEEVNYLKNILANNTAISQMLGTISHIPIVKKIRLSAECSPQDDHWSESSSSTISDHSPHVTTSAGICLHFKPSNHISLEYCATCSLSSQMAILKQEQEESDSLD